MVSSSFCDFQESSNVWTFFLSYLPYSGYVLPMFCIILKGIVFLILSTSQIALIFNLHYASYCSNNFLFNPSNNFNLAFSSFVKMPLLFLSYNNLICSLVFVRSNWTFCAFSLLTLQLFSKIFSQLSPLNLGQTSSSFE